MISPRAVTEIHACHHEPEVPQPSLLAASNYKYYVEELKRLKQENMQLRRDLEDANNRIRALEAAEHHAQSSSLFMPSSSYADSDDFSVEVSVTSSTTTVQMGSLSTTGQNQDTRQDIDEQDSISSDGRSTEKTTHATSYSSSSRPRRRYHRNPFAQAAPRKIPELRRLFSSESESDSPSASMNPIPEVKIPVSKNKNNNNRYNSTSTPRKHKEVASYAMNYFRRADSHDSESDTAPTDGSSPLTFEV